MKFSSLLFTLMGVGMVSALSLPKVDDLTLTKEFNELSDQVKQEIADALLELLGDEVQPTKHHKDGKKHHKKPDHDEPKKPKLPEEPPKEPSEPVPEPQPEPVDPPKHGKDGKHHKDKDGKKHKKPHHPDEPKDPKDPKDPKEPEEPTPVDPPVEEPKPKKGLGLGGSIGLAAGAIAAGGLLAAFISSRRRHDGVVLDEDNVRRVRDDVRRGVGNVEYAVRDAREATQA